MAVFPDRIVLKNSTDTQAQIIAAIEEGGANEIGQGEIVLGLRAGDTGIYAKDETGTIVSLGGGGGGGTAGVSSIIAGTGVSIDQPTGDVTITATGSSTAGVSSIIAGSGVSVDQSTGDVTITATGITGNNVTAIYAGDGIDIDQSTGNVTITATGGAGGGGDSTLNLVFDIATATDGKIDFEGLGSSGIFVEAASDETDVWIVVYCADGARAADSGRAYGVAPSDYSGVLLELTLGLDITSISPAVPYFNADFPAAEKLYLAVRTTAGVANDTAQVYLASYANTVAEDSGGGSGGGAVDSVNGQTGTVVLDINDLVSADPSDGNLLQFNEIAGEWEVAGSGDAPSGSFYRYYALSENPMLGPTTAYPGLTELLADGWTEIPGYADADDSAVGFFPPQSWQDAAQGVSFLSGQVRGYDNSEFYLNTNGGCGFDKNGSKVPGRSGVATNDATLTDLYVCHKSSDLKGKLAGWKETVGEDGVRFFHVRQSYFDPYNGADFWIVETVFSSDGCITVKYGDATAPDDIPDDAASTLDHGIVVYDSLNAGTSGKNPILGGSTVAGFPGLTPAGNYVFETYKASGPVPLKVKLEDLANVVVASPPIADGSILVYNSTTEEWNPSTDLVSRGALLSAVAASTDFADFKSRIAAL